MPSEDARADKMLVQVRLPRELVREVDHLAIDADLYRAQMWERLLRLGIERLAAPDPRAGDGGGG